MTESVDVKFCPQCGASVVGMRFCGQCGYAARSANADPAEAWARPAAEDLGAEAGPLSSPVPAQAFPSDGGSPAQTGPSSVTWPVPERVVDVNGRKVVLEIAVTAAVFIVLGVLFGIASRSTLSVLQYLGDLPGQLVLSTLALILSWAFILFALIWTGWQLLKTNPVARPLTVVWTVLTLAITLVGSAPWWAWLIVIILAACSVALYFSPWAKRAFAVAEGEAARPTPIEFSLVLSRVLFGLSALNGVALLPTLGNVSELNAMGEWTGQGAVGTKLAFGLILLLATVALGFFAIGKVRNRDAVGRMILLGMAVVSLLSSWLVFGGDVNGSLGLGSTGLILGVIVTWGAILVPLWLGAAAASWFGTKELKLSMGADPNA